MLRVSHCLITNIIEKDQLTDALLNQFHSGKKMHSDDLNALALALNQLVANGGQDAKLAESLVNASGNGQRLKAPNYLDPRVVKNQVANDKSKLSLLEKLTYTRKISEEEQLYNNAKNVIAINGKQTEISRYGGDAVFGAPGKTLNVMRILIGAATIASGVNDISNGNTGIGRFKVVGGALMFVPINGRPVPAKNASIRGGAGEVNIPNKIDYTPAGSYVSQGKDPVCGPACANMIVNDKSGKSIDLTKIVSEFKEIRPTGVTAEEVATVLTNRGVKNSINNSLFPKQLENFLANGNQVIVQVKAGQGRHFIIVDKIQKVNGVDYYMVRDPFTGSYGVKTTVLDSQLNQGNIKSIKIGK